MLRDPLFLIVRRHKMLQVMVLLVMVLLVLLKMRLGKYVAHLQLSKSMGVLAAGSMKALPLSVQSAEPLFPWKVPKLLEAVCIGAVGTVALSP